MFEHSVPVPFRYKQASKMLQNIKENGSKLEFEILLLHSRRRTPVYGLLEQILKNYPELDTVLEKSQLLVKEPRLSPWLARVLVHELLWRDMNWSKTDINSHCKAIQTILSHYNELVTHKEDFNLKVNAHEVVKPRYVRVNTLKVTVGEAINGFCEKGTWQLVRPASNTYEDYLLKVSSLNENEFMIDIHVKDMLVFAPKTHLQGLTAFKEKEILFQDKASCVAVKLLDPPPNSIVLEIGSAPGMKTSYLAAKINNQGKVYAVDRDEERFESMCENLKDMGATCVQPMLRDALTVTASDCPNVEYILVDPSCTGSGMTNRIKTSDEPAPSADRLKRMSGLQIMLLKHALSKFPNAKRVVYSTCSIHTEENEYVVEEAVKFTKFFNLVSAQNILNGKDKNEVAESIGDNCVNFRYEKDFTNGFFIAVFERKSEDEINKIKLHDPKETNQSSKPTKKVWKSRALLGKKDDSTQEKTSLNESSEVQLNDHEEIDQFSNSTNKKIKKSKKRKLSEENNKVETSDVVALKKSKQKVKESSSNDSILLEQSAAVVDDSLKPKKKKKKVSTKNTTLHEQNEAAVDDSLNSKKKKKKNQNGSVESKKKKKHNKSVDLNA